MKKTPPENPATWKDFGVFLFRHREADPGYYVLDALRELKYPPAQLKRFCVAWMTFYNLGIAARASELTGNVFYKFLFDLYPTAKRASERRHFRGEAGLIAIGQWQKNWPKPEGLMDHVMHDNMGDIRKACEIVPQMGDYFRWKIGDLTEVLTQQSVLFRGWENVSPNVPQQGAALIAKEAGKPNLTTEQVYRSIAKQMMHLEVQSPYATWRYFDVQDAETICCVYKQYRSGGYVPGLRTAKAAARLQADGGGCKTASAALDQLLKRQTKPLNNIGVLSDILEGKLIYTVRSFLDGKC